MIECVKNDDFWCICVLGMPCKSHWVCVTIFMLSDVWTHSGMYYRCSNASGETKFIIGFKYEI